MQTARIVQAVILMMIVAMAASCASGKEYTTRLFAPRPPAKIDTQTVSFRFLGTDTINADKEGWVSTDIILSRDTATNTIAMEKLSKIVIVKTDTIEKIETKIVPSAVPVAKNINSGEVRKKRTREME